MSIELKEIRETIIEMEAWGQTIEELEGLLINTDDRKQLIQSIYHKYNGISQANGSLYYNSGETIIYGVKIIDNPYVPPGSIFKIFKNDKMNKMSGTFLPHYQNNVIPMPDNIKLPTVADDKKNKNKEKKIDKIRKHSQTRRIELD